MEFLHMKLPQEPSPVRCRPHLPVPYKAPMPSQSMISSVLTCRTRESLLTYLWRRVRSCLQGCRWPQSSCITKTIPAWVTTSYSCRDGAPCSGLRPPYILAFPETMGPHAVRAELHTDVQEVLSEWPEGSGTFPSPSMKECQQIVRASPI